MLATRRLFTPWARLRPRPWPQATSSARSRVYIRFQRGRGIGEKIRNLLEKDYQGPTIVVANDGSSDGTADVVRSFGDPRIGWTTSRKFAARRRCRSQIVPTLSQDIAIFSDATVAWPKDAISKITRNFADPEVGCVAVDLLFVQAQRHRGTGPQRVLEVRAFPPEVWRAGETNIVTTARPTPFLRLLFPESDLTLARTCRIPCTLPRWAARGVDSDVVVEETSSATHASQLKMCTDRRAQRDRPGLPTSSFCARDTASPLISCSSTSTCVSSAGCR